MKAGALHRAIGAEASEGIDSLSRFARGELVSMIEILIACLDARDGDPDVEDDDPSSDPLDGGELTSFEDSHGCACIEGDDNGERPCNPAAALNRDLAVAA